MTKEGEKVQYNGILIPGDPFLRVYHQPESFADKLQRKGEEVIREWEEANRGVVNKTALAEKTWTLVSHTFVSRGKQETTELYMQLSTFGYTNKGCTTDEEIQPMQLRDLKVRFARLHAHPPTVIYNLNHLQVLLKVRTTFGILTAKPESIVKGFVLDYFGYNQSLIHYLGFLKSKVLGECLARILHSRAAIQRPIAYQGTAAAAADDSIRKGKLAATVAAAVAAAAAKKTKGLPTSAEQQESCSSGRPRSPRPLNSPKTTTSTTS